MRLNVKFATFESATGEITIKLDDAATIDLFCFIIVLFIARATSTHQLFTSSYENERGTALSLVDLFL
jgi:hypothetical protein